MRASGEGESRAWEAPALALLLAGALAFYLWLSCRSTFWGDEEFAAKRCLGSWADCLAALRADVHPPLYYVLARLWQGALAWIPIEPALRSLSALCAVGALFALKRLLERWQLPAAAAWAATLLCALHPSFVLYATMAKGYAMLALASLLGWHAYLDLCAEPAAWRRRAAFGFCMAYLPYIHMAGGLGAAAYLIHHGISRLGGGPQRPGTGRGLLAAYAVAGAVFTPQLGTALFQLGHHARESWAGSSSLAPLPVLAGLVPFYTGTGGLAPWLGWSAAAVATAGMLRLAWRPAGPARALALAAGASAAAWVLLPWAWSLRTPCLAARATLPLLPLALAAACLGMSGLRGRLGLAAGCLLLAAAWPWVLTATAAKDIHEDMRSASAFLAAARKPGERIYLKGYLEDYYLQRALEARPLPYAAEGPRYWLVNRLSDAALCRGPHDCPEAYPGRYRVLATREWPSASSPAAHLVVRLVEDRARTRP